VFGIGKIKCKALEDIRKIDPNNDYELVYAKGKL